MRLEVTRRSHHRSEPSKKGGKRRVVTYRTGESFDGTERELLAFSDRLKASVPEKPKRKPKAEPVKDELEQADGTDGN